ncbi:carbamoyl-phosphate synthase small chain [Dissulfurispira thermophila]|uniref:Carbamoyl phosphate synthase small chain n=2 Tax=root TaxID=1 RepID=A0A7G1H073_9BACT|nr:glutamine-hydrolyzing carbamoyl-phosphate synthase small subunit [Dissulfurispira thermophila]BCB96185.1 carbamoyl-phosphate synthase small chain [Dissulfurispira thermophila]
MSKALLVLADGTYFEGKGFGADGESIGEVVFNTSMTGYQEILTDPSYKGQIVTMTYTQIGNYGINMTDVESLNKPKVEGFIIKEYFDFPSNWRSQMTLSQYLKDNNIVAIEGIDTRALTRHLRNSGVQMGIISTVDSGPESLFEKVRAHPGISTLDLVKEVTTKEAYTWGEGCFTISPLRRFTSSPLLISDTKKVVVYDFGVKFNILRNLVDAGFNVSVVPAYTPAEAVLEMKPDGVLLSNGPGDPETVTYGIENVKKLIGKKPIFGICLGHQILGLAMGGRTYKLKFGHHGGNHPVKDLKTGRVEITAQNHNYCVDINSLKGQVRLTHQNLFDGSEEGMEHVEYPVFSVQHHPEAGPGPNDSTHLFKRFREMMEERC